LCDAVPAASFVRAFTSPIIRKLLAARGDAVYSFAEALKHLAEEGFGEVIVQPTHLLYGYEYNRVKETAESFAPCFGSLLLGKPLLSDTKDICQLADCLGKKYSSEKGRATVFLGHGTEHFANAVYPALQTAFRLDGIADAYVGTIEGWPTLDDVLRELKGKGYSRVRLVPLMLVAGDHAINDMAGDTPKSWKSRLRAAGFEVECSMGGLGLLPEVQELYCAHLTELLANRKE
ncbi:MAG: sirohydrochlorin cobaltochelatase, partial [Angelakisella sp.]